VTLLPKLRERIYINPWLRFDVYESGWTIMIYEGREVKRRRLSDVRRKAIMKAFEEELGPLVTGSPIPMPAVKPMPVETEEAVERLEGLEEKLKKLTKRVNRLLEKLGEKEI
jgi:hypothetical protein